MARSTVSRVLAAAALAAGLGGMQAAAESLSDALVAAYRGSDLLEQNRALLRARDEGLAQAVAALRPVITFVGDGGFSQTLDGGATLVDDTSARLRLTAEMSLFDGGSGQLGVDAANEVILATRAALVSVEQSVLLANCAPATWA
jgi:outer membrane protein